MSGFKDWIQAAEEVQLQVCRDLNVDPQLGLKLMRTADVSDTEIKEISLYRRHNRATDCLVAVGSPIPKDIVVYDHSHQENGFNLWSKNSTTIDIIMAASHT